MLTTQDLHAIRNIVEEVVEKKLEEKLTIRFKEFEERLDKKIDEKLDIRFKKELTPIRRSIRRLRKDMNVFIRLFDEEHVDLRKRMNRVENHLHLPKFVD